MSHLQAVEPGDAAGWARLLTGAGWTIAGTTPQGETAFYPPGQESAPLPPYLLGTRGGEMVLAFQADYGPFRAGKDYAIETVRRSLAPRATYHEALVDDELRRLRARRDAHRALAAEASEAVELPAVASLSAFLAEPDVDAEYRVDRLLPTGGNVLFPAPAKAGKSTAIGNLCRSFADGDAFLGTFAVKPARVVLIDNEMDPRGLRRWLREQNIQHPENVSVVSLRGRTRTFDIIDDDTRAKWAAAIAGADVLIFDCLRPVLDALGLDESREAGQFLVALDALKAEAGISEAVLVHHMGHTGERARGDSRLLGWPDVTWKITLEQPDEPTSPRYFSAFGRDVDETPMRLDYDPDTRRMSTTGMTKRDAAIEVAVAWTKQLLAGTRNGMSGAQIEEAWSHDKPGFTKSNLRQATHVLQTRAETVVVPGPRGAKVHMLLQLASSPHLASTSPATSADHLAAPYRGEVARSDTDSEQNPPRHPETKEQP